MKIRRPTSQQVAEFAGVSRTTVSLVLNEVKDIKIPDATKQRVLDAANQLGYVPDAAARSLVSGRTQTLGFILHGTYQLEVDAYLPRLLSSLFTVSQKHSFQVIVETVKDFNQDSHAKAYRDLVKAKQIDGLIAIYPSHEDEQLIELIDTGFPAVLLGSVRHPEEHSVAISQKKSIGLLMQHLINLGYERIAHISFAPKEVAVSQARIRNYQEMLQNAHLATDESLIRFGNFSAESGYTAMKSLLSSAVRPDALFAGNDTIAIGAIAAIQEAGLRIPEDIAIVGYDDIPIAKFMTPALTTVHAPSVEQGRLAGEMLIELVNGIPIREKQIRLDTELIIRKSCGS